MAEEKITLQHNSSIINYIKDKGEDVCSKFDIQNKKIEYDNKIKSSRKIEEITGDEEIVRAYILTRLVKDLKYNKEDIELERTYEIGRPKVNKPRIDIIVKEKNSEDIFLYIELKTPTEFENKQDETIEKQLFNLASQEIGVGHNVKYLVLYTVDIEGENINDKCIIIDYKQYPNFAQWKDIKNSVNQIPAMYGVAIKESYIKGGKRDLEKSLVGLDYIEEDLHDVLWGGGGTNDNDIFAALTNIILAKIQDEGECQESNEYTFQIKRTKDGGDFEDDKQLFDRINALYNRALKERLNIQEPNSAIVDTNKFSISKLKYTISKLERFNFTEGKDEVMGRDIMAMFFEKIIRDGFKQTKGQFFTHPNIVRFMLWALQTDRLAIKCLNEMKERLFRILE